MRIFTAGFPALEGDTVLAKRQYFMQNHDKLRTGLMQEPRGHAELYGAVLTPSADDADLDVFFLNTEGYSPMCGHAILAITKVVIETGIIRKTGSQADLIINVPAGRNYAHATIEDGEVRYASFHNVPSFVYLRNGDVDIAGLGQVRFDVAYGGAFYAIVEAQPLGLGLTDKHYNALIERGRQIKKAILQNFKIEHTFEPDLSSLFGVIFTGPAHDPSHHSRNVTVFEDGEVDRSPTGTGLSARAALHFANGELGANETIAIESIIDSTMTVRVVEQTKFGHFGAIIPELGGAAHIMGQNEFYFDPRDPLSAGFILR